MVKMSKNEGNPHHLKRYFQCDTNADQTQEQDSSPSKVRRISEGIRNQQFTKHQSLSGSGEIGVGTVQDIQGDDSSVHNSNSRVDRQGKPLAPGQITQHNPSSYYDFNQSVNKPGASLESEQETQDNYSSDHKSTYSVRRPGRNLRPEEQESLDNLSSNHNPISIEGSLGSNIDSAHETQDNHASDHNSTPIVEIPGTSLGPDEVSKAQAKVSKKEDTLDNLWEFGLNEVSSNYSSTGENGSGPSLESGHGTQDNYSDHYPAQNMDRPGSSLQPVQDTHDYSSEHNSTQNVASSGTRLEPNEQATLNSSEHNSTQNVDRPRSSHRPDEQETLHKIACDYNTISSLNRLGPSLLTGQETQDNYSFEHNSTPNLARSGTRLKPDEQDTLVNFSSDHNSASVVNRPGLNLQPGQEAHDNLLSYHNSTQTVDRPGTRIVSDEQETLDSSGQNSTQNVGRLGLSLTPDEQETLHKISCDHNSSSSVNRLESNLQLGQDPLDNNTSEHNSTQNVARSGARLEPDEQDILGNLLSNHNSASIVNRPGTSLRPDKQNILDNLSSYDNSTLSVNIPGSSLHPGQGEHLPHHNLTINDKIPGTTQGEEIGDWPNCSLDSKQKINEDEIQNDSTTSKKTPSRKDTNSIKKDTEHGNEYQRMIQILLRHRGSKIPDFKIGTEVKKVGDLDDIVFCMGNSSRFIQVKHEDDTNNSRRINASDKKSNVKVVLHRLFDTNNHLGKPEFEIVRYFRSFCKIKNHETFGNSEITEINIVTNRPLRQQTDRKKYKNTKDKDETFHGFLEVDDFQNDSFLYLGNESGLKYSLKTDSLKGYSQFMKCLQDIYDKSELAQVNPNKTENASEFIEEFLKKVKIVVDYPKTDLLKKLVFEEVRAEKYHFMNDLTLFNFLASNMIYNEIYNLMKRGNGEEFLTNEDWEKQNKELKQMFEGVINTGIVKNETMNFLNMHRTITFDSNKINDLFIDIREFLTHKEKFIFLFSNVQNEKVAAIKTLNIVADIKEDRDVNLPKQFIVSYDDFQSLDEEKVLVKQFLSGVINTLIISIGIIDKDNGNNNTKEELLDKLMNISRVNKQKLVVISTCNNFFCDKVRHQLTANQYSEKSYNHNFSCLIEKSKEDVLSTQVSFQGKTIRFGSLLNNDNNFANSVIDENVLMKIMYKGDTPCLLDESAFVSPGYHEDYYIPRKLFQNLIDFKVVKSRMHEELFFLTQRNGMGHNELIKLLLENGISKKNIKEYPNKGKRKFIEENGIVVKGSGNELNYDIFQEITERNIICHWIHVRDAQLISVASNLKRKDKNRIVFCKPLPTTPEYTPEMNLLPDKTQEKVIILAGDSGVGKSTELTNVANRLLQNSADPPLWIVKVNLRTILDHNLDIEKTQIGQTVELMSDIGSKSDTSNVIAKKIIEEGLKKSQKGNFNMVLLLDGFNEISRKNQDNTCDFIRILSSECNIRQIWIVTQIQGIYILEQRLGVLAYLLENLDDKEQISLMVNYWNSNYSNRKPPEKYDIEVLTNDAEVALQTWKNSVSGKDDYESFTQISMNLIILSDILLTTDRRINSSIDLTNLYETFIRKRITIYNQVILEPERQLTEFEYIKEKMFENTIKEILHELAVKIILPTYQNNSATEKIIKEMSALQRFQNIIDDIKSNNGIEISSHTVLSKLGFLSVKLAIDFTHESFAKYFFSDYLVVHNLDVIPLKIFFINHVLTQRNLHLCRRFIDNAVKKLFGIREDVAYQGLKKKISALTNKGKGSKVIASDKTRNVTEVVENKLDHFTILFLHVIGTRYHSFLGQWLRNELRFCAKNEEHAKFVTDVLKQKTKDKVPSKLRGLLSIDKDINGEANNITIKKILADLNRNE